jgi:hypothetical protein
MHGFLVPRPSLDLPAFDIACNHGATATLKAGRSREGLGTRLDCKYYILGWFVWIIQKFQCTVVLL